MNFEPSAELQAKINERQSNEFGKVASHGFALETVMAAFFEDNAEKTKQIEMMGGVNTDLMRKLDEVRAERDLAIHERDLLKVKLDQRVVRQNIGKS